MPRVSLVPLEGDVEKTVEALLTEYKVDPEEEAFVKINAVDFRKGCYTSPEIIEATIKALKNLGAGKVYVMENSTQGNFTRLVFKVTGIGRAIKKAGGKPIYLDEEKSVKVEIGDFKVDFPKIVYESIVEGGSFYLSLPKLKTHDMTTVTLNLKNQFGFIYHKDRRVHHSKFELHRFIASIYDFIKPDFSIVDGKFATIHGHYPLERMFDKYILPMNLLIAGDDALAVDIVAARLLGYDVGEIEHLKIAEERYRVEGEIEITGDFERYRVERQPYTPLGIYPEGVEFVKGRELACREGCVDNTLMVLEMLHVDYGGEGDFTIVFGKGFDDLDGLKPPVLVVGKCAVEEVGEELKRKYGDVILIPYCNDLAAVTEALMKLMKIKATQIVPVSTLELIIEWIKAKIHGSTSRTPSLF